MSIRKFHLSNYVNTQHGFLPHTMNSLTTLNSTNCYIVYNAYFIFNVRRILNSYLTGVRSRQCYSLQRVVVYN